MYIFHCKCKNKLKFINSLVFHGANAESYFPLNCSCFLRAKSLVEQICALDDACGKKGNLVILINVKNENNSI